MSPIRMTELKRHYRRRCQELALGLGRFRRSFEGEDGIGRRGDQVTSRCRSGLLIPAQRKQGQELVKFVRVVVRVGVVVFAALLGQGVAGHQALELGGIFVCGQEVSRIRL